jgi:hypothetical protein
MEKNQGVCHDTHQIHSFSPWNPWFLHVTMDLHCLQVPEVLHSVFFGLGVTGDLPKPWDEGEIYWENGGLT